MAVRKEERAGGGSGLQSGSLGTGMGPTVDREEKVRDEMRKFASVNTESRSTGRGTRGSRKFSVCLSDLSQGYCCNIFTL